jgi:hypothetical protein
MIQLSVSEAGQLAGGQKNDSELERLGHFVRWKIQTALLQLCAKIPNRNSIGKYSNAITRQLFCRRKVGCPKIGDGLTEKNENGF